MGALLRWREPAVVVLLALVGVRALLAVGFGLAALADQTGRYGLAALAAAGSLREPAALALLAVLAVTCHAAPVTPRARRLTVLALVATALAVLAGLVAAVVSLVQPGLGQLPPPLRVVDAADRLLALVVPLLAGVGLAVLLRRPTAAAQAEDEPAAVTADVGQEQADAPDAALEPTWQPGAATGAVWLSAGDAASGRPPVRSRTQPTDGDQDEPHPWAAGPR